MDNFFNTQPILNDNKPDTNYCPNKCCKIDTRAFNDELTKDFTYDKNNKKGGVFVFNSIRGSILLIQSRGKLWGCPKGTVEKEEDVKTCALRELKEETGIDLPSGELTSYITIKNKGLYYLYDTTREAGQLPKYDEDEYNDATGFTWIKIDCLFKMMNFNMMKMNYHTKYIILNYLNFKL